MIIHNMQDIRAPAVKRTLIILCLGTGNVNKNT